MSLARACSYLQRVGLQQACGRQRMDLVEVRWADVTVLSWIDLDGSRTLASHGRRATDGSERSPLQGLSTDRENDCTFP